MGPAALDAIRTIVGCYRDLTGTPVGHVALVQHGDRGLVDDITGAELDEIRELTDLVCLAGLADREFFNPVGRYCNADCFILYSQRFEGLDHIALVTRRRDGLSRDARPLQEVAFTEPEHTSHVDVVSLDETLLTALATFRRGDSSEWGRWQNAIACFNQANTDGDAVRYQTEWTLMAAAFERILDADSKAEDVAARFAAMVVPDRPLRAQDGRRPPDRHVEPAADLRYEWMREFYRVRGDFAHGTLETRQPMMWQPREHLVLAAIAFPLVVQSLLSRRGVYALADKNRAQLNAFERLADADFFARPADDRGATDSVWTRLVHEERIGLARERAVPKLEALLRAASEP